MLLLAASFSSQPAVAQGASGSAASALQSSSWRIPIHTQPDDPALGRYGVWAAGIGYKVSFHDGLCFYPLLGPAAPARR